jgi:alpha-amylase/alpha-mannosidase (GH57 family)
MPRIAVAFLWHQHQPYYPDDVAGENPMPWVRLHGVKDYYGMALHLLEFPEMRCTINLVPSLLVQLQGYTERGATDQFLKVSRVPAAQLSEADALFLLDHFFMANHEQMIRPFPRYADLLQRRGHGRNTAQEALRRFNERDLRDLQVWFNLTWVHPLAFEKPPGAAEGPGRPAELVAGLRALRDKGRHFSEEEKNWLLDKHLQILGEVIPLHKRLSDSGQVELSTTPFYHPILPLLLDKKLAREAMPDVRLPRFQGGYPEDAALHVGRAVRQHREIFGREPRGMWPAEGSVCQQMIPLLAQNGIRWIATDEEILGGSTQGYVSRDGRGHVRNPEALYKPYRVADGGHELGIVFRDHALSDLIGFHYQRSNGEAAAEDFVAKLRGIREAIHHPGPALVSVILDGENCWEHYPGGGVSFLRALYEKCSRSADVEPVTVGDYLQRHPPADTLPHLFAGSWISHNYAIWIGHEEDNTAWDLLHRTREYVLKKGGPPKTVNSDQSSVISQPTTGNCSLITDHCSLTPVDRAWEELYIAEGSDWFWWYGDDHSSEQDALFDYLFRKHLQNVYLLLGDAPPADLGRPIKRKHQRANYTFPRSLLDVTINGRRTFYEWLGAGRYQCQNERGTMAMATQGLLKELYFGFNTRTLFVRVDFTRPAKAALADVEALRLGFVEPGGYVVWVRQPARPDAAAELLHNDEPVADAGVLLGVEQIVELAVPFERLGLKPDAPLQFFVDLLQGNQSVDRAPREGTITLLCPSSEFERIMWDV